MDKPNTKKDDIHENNNIKKKKQIKAIEFLFLKNIMVKFCYNDMANQDCFISNIGT